ncbi:MAG: roadblock/LC7 domain-containing protein [Meiothermus sp.]|uniref:roadblock/LC7 domain-containing protein n=1 Tax=Meiothermus sp. TaxID=1955249 RepID=UPI0025CCB380|nr:roadblock/LC7 domain-containing protein [Meiothermus sp.]MCS7058667.1 roadblock/LC7 domain-containing protein [Meiothermus sp.]MCS7195259.1 roadblock/LC7 domain-containing protein [Meiothermus sp.]MCX7741517.1 roadblock/LC7 domain-containing protein [Meiothermus sp.]MDW8090006.1 roadblock/LC7 domain-containing protein [Meiothermus sp.]MDW8480657.1 roadblock/LC7 domain-containing protein [Meiothermus sp.]
MRMLESLSMAGVRQAVLASQDGLVIESTGKTTPEPELLAAELAALARASRTLTRHLGGELRRFTLATEHREVLVVVFNGYCLGAVVEKGSDRKSIGQELSRLALRLAQSL